MGGAPLRSVEAINLEETIKALSAVDKGLASRLKSEIRSLAKPTLAKAKGYAASLGLNPTGSFAASLSLKTSQNGVAWISTDPGGGVIEFANIGARILTGPRAGKRAGVPVGSGGPPRALLKAVLEDQESLIQGLNRAIETYVDEVFDVA